MILLETFPSLVQLVVFDGLDLKGVSCRLDLVHRSEPKQLQVWRPEELLVVARVNQLLFDGANRIFDVADQLAAIATLQLPDLRLVVEDGVLEDLLYVFVADLRRLFPWRPQVLSAVNGQVDLGVAEVLGLVVGEQKHCAVSDVAPCVTLVPSDFFVPDVGLVKLYARDDFSVPRLAESSRLGGVHYRFLARVLAHDLVDGEARSGLLKFVEHDRRLHSV